MPMSTLYFDVVSGASGDMILSSLVDIGVPLDYLRAELAKLSIPGFTIDIEKQKRSGISASHLVLHWDTPKAYRHVRQILDLIESAHYPARVHDRCRAVLTRLGQAEAKIHDMPIEKVHFHEIGAVDTIADIAGICLALEYLDAGEILFSALSDGKGTVETAHGRMPVPVPAVAEMAQGFELKVLDIEGELLTPTGCAILTALGRQRTLGFSGTIAKCGYGCGAKVLDKTPNILRVFLMDANQEPSDDGVCVIESDMDHISGEIMADVASRLMLGGALDASWTPLFMKKGRPGYRLTVMCSTDTGVRQALIDTIMVHSRTLGVRFHAARRIVAERTQAEDTLKGERIDVKQCSYGGRSFTKPEYESLVRVSEKTGIPVIELMEEFWQGEGKP
jgi:pyridinium-3,5-bisthiocarboxylic acid mononucleotide nickel chelatase